MDAVAAAGGGLGPWLSGKCARGERRRDQHNESTASTSAEQDEGAVSCEVPLGKTKCTKKIELTYSKKRLTKTGQL